MKAAWVSDIPTWELAIVEDAIVITSKNDVVELDDHGRERWRRTFDRRPSGLTRCGRGVAFQLPDRLSATQIVALDLEGHDLWHYDREWRLIERGISGDDHGLVLFGNDYGPEANQRWVVLDAANGAAVLDVPAPTDSAPEIAGSWLLAPIDRGSGGFLRTDRDATNPVQLTSWPYMGEGANDELMLLNTAGEPATSEMIAIELASGRERWRAPGGRVLEVEVQECHAAWATGPADNARPIVHELATGSRTWTGDTLPAVQGRSYYRSRLGPDAVVFYCGNSHVVYYSLHSATPLKSRAWDGDSPRVNRFWGKYFLEAVHGTLVCWELT